MTVEQIYSIMNDVTNELIGKTGVVNKDLSNIVDVGTELFSASSVDNYCSKVLPHDLKVCQEVISYKQD